MHDLLAVCHACALERGAPPLVLDQRQGGVRIACARGALTDDAGFTMVLYTYCSSFS